MIFGDAEFRDRAIFHADDIQVKGQVNAIMDATNNFGNALEFFQCFAYGNL